MRSRLPTVVVIGRVDHHHDRPYDRPGEPAKKKAAESVPLPFVGAEPR
jgi:hypothetical protein